MMTVDKLYAIENVCGYVRVPYLPPQFCFLLWEEKYTRTTVLETSFLILIHLTIYITTQLTFISEVTQKLPVSWHFRTPR